MKKQFKDHTYIISIDPPLPPKRQQVAVWPGDPHLGDDNSSAALCELFVMGYIAKQAKVILTGDLFDSWLVVLFSNRLSWSDRLFLHILLGRSGVFVPGNHDWFIRPFLPLLSKANKRWRFPHMGERHVVVELGGALCFFEHGDRYDGVLSHWSLTVVFYLFGWIGRILRRLKGETQLITQEHKRGNWFWKKTANKVANGVIQAASEREATICGAGHTHFAERREMTISDENVLYVNCGSFDGRESTLVVFWQDDAGQLRVSVHTIITRKHPQPRS